jgi:hypothetical protein
VLSGTVRGTPHVSAANNARSAPGRGVPAGTRLSTADKGQEPSVVVPPSVGMIAP